MQKVLGYMRKAMEDYQMVEPNDRIAVGISGGKDSVVMLEGLIRLRSFYGVPFQLYAITVDPVFDGVQTDYSAIEDLCARSGVPYHIRRSELGDIIFRQRQETNPCSLCARMRRGILHDMCNALGCNKIALGHHSDDAVETFIMNLFQEGRIGCFQPVTYLSRKDLTMIRPLLYAPEKEIVRAQKRTALPAVKSVCPVDGVTTRQKTKDWLREMEQGDYPGLRKRIYGAMVRGHVSGW